MCAVSVSQADSTMSLSRRRRLMPCALATWWAAAEGPGGPEQFDDGRQCGAALLVIENRGAVHDVHEQPAQHAGAGRGRTCHAF